MEAGHRKLGIEGHKLRLVRWVQASFSRAQQATLRILHFIHEFRRIRDFSEFDNETF